MKKITPFLFVFFILLFTNCEKEEIATQIENNYTPSIISSKISFPQLYNEIETPKIKSILQCKYFYTLNNDSFLRTNTTEPTFIKIQKSDSLTTYILHLNTYSQLKPYFLKLVITKNKNETEKMGFLKYIPSSPSTVLNIDTFIGEVQILDANFEVTATSIYNNGIKQPSNQSTTSNRMVCTDEILITEVRCSHGGLHGVGEPCDQGFINDAYYVVSIFTRCTARGDQLVQIIEDTGNGNNGTGGVYPASIFLNPFLTTLTEEELVIYNTNPSIQEYLVNNLIVEEIPNYNPQLGGYSTIIIIKPEAKQFAKELIDLAILQTNQTDANSIINIVLQAKIQDKFYNDIDDAFLLSIDQYMDMEVAQIDPVLMAQLEAYFTVQCAVLRYNHPDWSDLTIYWEASKEMLHITLDIFGLVPVFGEVADLTNGVLYTIEGDGVNATLSFAGAVPIAGWAAVTTKYAVKIVDASQTATTIATKIKLTWKVVGNTIDFGSSSQLRKVLGLVGNGVQAHHILPWAGRNHDIIQKAAKSGSAFHMNEALNGIAIATWRNQPNHNAYNNLIRSKLDALPTNLNPNQAYTELINILNQAKQSIINNPNTHLNDLIF